MTTTEEILLWEDSRNGAVRILPLLVFTCRRHRRHHLIIIVVIVAVQIAGVDLHDTTTDMAKKVI